MALTQKQLEYQRNWRKNNPEGYKAQQKRTRNNRSAKMAEDPEFFAQTYYKMLEAGAVARSKPYNITQKQVATLVETQTRCNLSNRKVSHITGDPNKFSIDRIDNRYGYSAKNVQVVTAQINKHRLDATLEEFISMCCDVADHHRKLLKTSK